MKTRFKNTTGRRDIEHDLLLHYAEGNEEKPIENFIVELTDMEGLSF